LSVTYTGDHVRGKIASPLVPLLDSGNGAFLGKDDVRSNEKRVVIIIINK